MAAYRSPTAISTMSMHSLESVFGVLTAVVAELVASNEQMTIIDEREEQARRG